MWTGDKINIRKKSKLASSRLVTRLRMTHTCVIKRDKYFFILFLWFGRGTRYDPCVKQLDIRRLVWSRHQDTRPDDVLSAQRPAPQADSVPVIGAPVLRQIRNKRLWKTHFRWFRICSASAISVPLRDGFLDKEFWCKALIFRVATLYTF